MIAILYAATKKPADWQDYSFCACYPPNIGTGVWIRIETRRDEDLADAVCRAAPRVGEIVLNAIEL